MDMRPWSSPSQRRMAQTSTWNLLSRHSVLTLGPCATRPYRALNTLQVAQLGEGSRSRPVVGRVAACFDPVSTVSVFLRGRCVAPNYSATPPTRLLILLLLSTPSPLVTMANDASSDGVSEGGTGPIRRRNGPSGVPRVSMRSSDNTDVACQRCHHRKKKVGAYLGAVDRLTTADKPSAIVPDPAVVRVRGPRRRACTTLPCRTTHTPSESWCSRASLTRRGL